MKKILQIDGGGIMGIIPATVLADLEKKLEKPLCECFDLITGISTGTIIGGAIAAGVPAKNIVSLYVDKGKKMVTRRSLWNPKNWKRSKYNREPFLAEISKLETEDKDEFGNPIQLGEFKLSDLKTQFISSSFNFCSQRTHFFKSWEEQGKYPLVDVMSWSALSSAYYFGEINVENYEWCHYQPDHYEQCQYSYEKGSVNLVRKKGAIFQDAGQSIHNNALIHLLVEILANGWVTNSEEISILSLGSGNLNQYISYHKATEKLKHNSFQSSLAAINNNFIVDQVLATVYVSRTNPKIQFKRIDTILKEEEYGLDKINYIQEYKQYGIELALQINDDLIETLKS
jgi:hypothetical protein